MSVATITGMPDFLPDPRHAVSIAVSSAPIGIDYAVVRGVLGARQLSALSAYFRDLEHDGCFTLDEEQVVGRRSCIHNEPVARLLQHRLTSVVMRATGLAVAPSYSYLVKYHPGAELERHVDRPQCAWNLSLLIDHEGGDPLQWPLHFDLGGTTMSARLAPGDAVVYSGTATPHWREILPEGQRATVLLGHYVEPGFDGSLD